MVVVGHFQDDWGDVEEAAVILVLVAIEVCLVVVDVHEADPGGRAAQLHLEAGTAGTRSKVPIEMVHTPLVADHAIGGKPRDHGLLDIDPFHHSGATPGQCRASCSRSTARGSGSPTISSELHITRTKACLGRKTFGDEQSWAAARAGLDVNSVPLR